jgi:deazaflavin-dependent oxidoreductase (nitroreductase family)
MGRLMGGSLTVITHSGRTSGRRHATPVEYVRDGSRVTILVARPERKQWWRNVRDSGAATLWLDGRERDGSAIVLAPPESTAALAAYVAARPRAAAAASGALAVVVDLSDDVAA